MALVARGGAAALTMSSVAHAVGAPSGSVYHRFPDRSALLAALWLRTLGRFHQGLLAALTTEPPHLAVALAARHTVEWSRINPDEAAVLLVGSTELGEAAWAADSRQRAEQANAEVHAAIDELVRRLDTDTDRVALAMVDLPYAVVRRYLKAGQPIPAYAPDLAHRAAIALLRMDRTTSDGATALSTG